MTLLARSSCWCGSSRIKCWPFPIPKGHFPACAVFKRLNVCRCRYVCVYIDRAADVPDHLIKAIGTGWGGGIWQVFEVKRVLQDPCQLDFWLCPCFQADLGPLGHHCDTIVHTDCCEVHVSVWSRLAQATAFLEEQVGTGESVGPPAPLPSSFPPTFPSQYGPCFNLWLGQGRRDYHHGMDAWVSARTTMLGPLIPHPLLPGSSLQHEWDLVQRPVWK